MKKIFVFAIIITILIVLGAGLLTTYFKKETKEDIKNPELKEEKIALVMKALSNPFFAKMEEGAKDYATKNDISLEVFGIERETDLDNQIAIIEGLISRNYSAIIIAPVDSKKLIPVCKKAIEKGIIVINVDNPLDKDTLKEQGLSITFIGPDNRKGAAFVGDYIKKKLNGRGNVVVIEGIKGVANAELRKQGFIEGITNNSEIKVIASESGNWHKDEAFTLVSNFLNKYKDINAILCANDNMALGALAALDAQGLKGKIILGGFDNIEEARVAIKDGTLGATVDQHPELMGSYGVELAKKAINKERIPDYKEVPVELITKENIK